MLENIKGRSFIFKKARAVKNKTVGITIVINKDRSQKLQAAYMITPPIVKEINCFKVRGPIILSSISINWGTAYCMKLNIEY